MLLGRLDKDFTNSTITSNEQTRHPKFGCRRLIFCAAVSSGGVLKEVG